MPAQGYINCVSGPPSAKLWRGARWLARGDIRVTQERTVIDRRNDEQDVAASSWGPDRAQLSLGSRGSPEGTDPIFALDARPGRVS